MIEAMPIQGKYGKRLAAIPMHFFQPHEEQAMANHGQTLQRLAERGGLAWSEAWAILSEVPWASVDHNAQLQAETAVRNLLGFWDPPSTTTPKSEEPHGR